MIKKRVFILVILLMIPLALGKLEISKNSIVDVVIPGISQPAVYDLEIKNLGAGDNFQIYNTVGVDIKPNGTFYIEENGIKDLKVEIWPGQSVLNNLGTFNFVYKIKDSKGQITEDVMLIRILNLEDSLDINAYNINLNSDSAVVYVKNRGSFVFPEIKANFKSSFFDFSQTFSLKGYEKKEFEIALNKEKIKDLVAGSYIISSNIETYNVKKTIENTFRFTEKEDIKTEESKTGLLVMKTVIKKINEGNLASFAQVRVSKNIISRLFTTFNIEPSRVDRSGAKITYVFQKEVVPGETYTIKVTTNWFYPLIILIAIVVIVLLVRIYTSTFLVVKKRTTFVKTKGGEFALKVSLIVRAKNYVEKINIIDKLPSLVKLHESFTTPPDKIDEKNRRLEWNIDSLQPGEERIFSYIFYSRLAPVGKFELPIATAVYERDGKVHETESNRVFFLNEVRRGYEYKGE